MVRFERKQEPLIFKYLTTNQKELFAVPINAWPIHASNSVVKTNQQQYVMKENRKLHVNAQP